MQQDSAIDWRVMPCYEDPRRPGKKGYVQLAVRGKPIYAHRLTYQECYGDVLLTTDVIAHHCDNRRCRQPLHLFKTTTAGNNRDMFEKGRCRGPSKDFCFRGHSLADAMVGRKGGSTYKRCRPCTRDWKRARRLRAKAEARDV